MCDAIESERANRLFGCWRAHLHIAYGCNHHRYHLWYHPPRKNLWPKHFRLKWEKIRYKKRIRMDLVIWQGKYFMRKKEFLFDSNTNILTFHFFTVNICFHHRINQMHCFHIIIHGVILKVSKKISAVFRKVYIFCVGNANVNCQTR